MNKWTVQVEIPLELCEEALTAHLIIMNWSQGSTDLRCTHTERIEKHIWALVTAILIKKMTEHLRLK